MKIWSKFGLNRIKIVGIKLCAVLKKPVPTKMPLVLRCVSEQSDALKRELRISKEKILYRHTNFFPLMLEGSKHLLSQ